MCHNLRRNQKAKILPLSLQKVFASLYLSNNSEDYREQKAHVNVALLAKAMK